MQSRRVRTNPPSNCFVRRPRPGGVGGGIDEQLRGRRPLVALEQRDNGAEVPSGAVAADGDAIGIGAEVARVGQRPAECGPGVVERRRERMLGREPVGHAEHVRAGLAAQDAARRVVRVEIANHETAAVKVDEQRRLGPGSARRRIVADGDPVIAGGDLEVEHGADRQRRSTEDDRLPPVPPPTCFDARFEQSVLDAPAADAAQELRLRIELLAIDHDRRLARQRNLHAVGKTRDQHGRRRAATGRTASVGYRETAA